MVVRNEKGLNHTQTLLRDFRQNLVKSGAQGPKNLKQLLELRNMLEVGEIVTAAALRRKESRGSHYREDFPMKDEERFGRPVIVRSEGNRIAFHEYQWSSTNLYCN